MTEWVGGDKHAVGWTDGASLNAGSALREWRKPDGTTCWASPNVDTERALRRESCVPTGRLMSWNTWADYVAKADRWHGIKGPAHVYFPPPELPFTPAPAPPLPYGPNGAPPLRPLK